MKKWVADFETTTDPDDCRVWLWAVMEIDNPENFIWGRTIDSFLKWCQKGAGNGKIWFHNLKFDSQFIISKLLSSGWQWKEKGELSSKSFSTLITSRGDYYSMKMMFNRGKKSTYVEILDSMKLLKMSVSRVSQAFRIGIPKMEIDYDLKRPIGYNPTPLELLYINSDCKIIAIALNKLFNTGCSGITLSQAAMADFRKRRTRFSDYFPHLDDAVETDIRQAYKGGFTYLNPLYADVDIGSGFFLDKNSMYPSQVMRQMLPIGRPVLFEGKFEPDGLYKLCIQKVSFVGKLKEGKLPFIRSKTDPNYSPVDYIEDTGGGYLTVTLTNMELDILFDNYDIDDIVYHRGWKFRSSSHIFDDYMDHWRREKEQAKEEDDYARYEIAKMFLNSLIGKFGGRSSGRQKYPVLDEEGIVQYKTKVERDSRKSIYSPIALFTTAYARCDLINTISKIREYGFAKYGHDVFVYSDTDSICTTLDVDDLTDINHLLELDDRRIGAWKLEKVFSKAKFLRSKCYMTIDYSGVSHATIAGLPKDLADKINIDQFREGFTTANLDPELLKYRALKPVLVKGGVVLKPTDYTL